ncbi:LytTR family transcriptional regulator [Pseudonocardia sulfidoxydans NBRC 16205]|uniref:LytTR family transcriptional regulator n=1 Tax=Pseudonocardia sulfidoxydans NBRC 16205 TaxID=1223511 RepID=A0A511DJL6_9PSEU|nr:LytTR family transcriptional regulator [Pseudonocardia sulfidoxydans NBRC 16205]
MCDAESGRPRFTGAAAARRTPSGRGHVNQRTALTERPRSRPAPDDDAPAEAPPDWGRRLRIATVVASVLVLVVTGSAWGLYRDVTSGLTTTDVIFGGDDGEGLNILLVGVDSRTDAQGNPLPKAVTDALHSGADTGVLNSDTIILLHLPPDGGAAAAFSIPRDSYVDIPGYRKDKINAAYPATKALKAEELVAAGGKSAREIDQESSAAGRSKLIETVQDLTGVHVDHYAEINLLGFYNLTQAVGGVDVCLKNPVSDELSGANFPAGPQTISGAAALAFVRQRHGLPEGDLSRIRRQQVFLAAMADKILSSGTLTNPSTLNALMDAAQKSLVIDSGWDILGFARQASDIAAGNLEFMTIPTQGGTTNNRGDVVLVDPGQVKKFVTDRSEATEDAADAATPATDGAPAVDPKTVTVDVGNASGATGLAGQIADTLNAAGYVRGTVGNVAYRPTSAVRYSTDAAEAGAEAVAAKLGLPVEKAADAPAGRVQVVLGADRATGAGGGGTGGTTTSPDTATPQTPAAGGGAVNAGGVPCID